MSWMLTSTRITPLTHRYTDRKVLPLNKHYLNIIVSGLEQATSVLDESTFGVCVYLWNLT